MNRDLLRIMIVMVLGLTPACSTALSIVDHTWPFWVPGSLTHRDGNTQTPFPILPTSQHPFPTRYQQVFAASEFGALPAGGAYLCRIFVRAQCDPKAGMIEGTNAQVWFSTTLKGPDQLSAFFDENTGSDVVKSGVGGRGFGMLGPGCPTGPDQQYVTVAEEVPLDLPFFYDPSRGNLLMEMKVANMEEATGPIYLDAEDVIGDSVSRVVALGVGATEGTTVDSVGIAVLFGFYDAPTLSFELSANTLLLGWGSNPRGFRLQWKGRLDGDSPWLDYPGTIVVDRSATRATIPKSRLGDGRYFRLFKDSGSLPQSGSHPAKVVPAAQVQEAPTE